jgi:hypothetical protein
MAIVWADGFEWVAAGTTPSSSPTLETIFDEKYPGNTDLDNSDADILSAPGPGHTVKFGDDAGERIQINLNDTIGRGERFWISFRLKVNRSGSSTPILTMLSTTGNSQADVSIDNLGVWTVDRLGSINVARFNPLNFVWGEWVHFEMQFVNGNASDTPNDGEIVIRINGTEYVNLTGIDTYNFGTGINRIRINNVGVSNDDGYELRDLIINDDTGTIANTWIGQQKHVFGLLPNANGSNTDWTRSTGTDDFALIDEVNRDMTDYIESSTSTDTTTCGLDATGSETGILALTVQTTHLLDAAGSEDIQHVVRHSSSESNSSSITVDSTSEATRMSVFETNPSTGSAWTAAEIDAAEAGVEYI